MTFSKEKKITALTAASFWSFRFITIIVQLAILLACIEFSTLLYKRTILPDKQVKEMFSQTSCTLHDKKITEKGRFVHRYRADFLIRYTVNNQVYQTWVTANGLDQGFSNSRSRQEYQLAQFETGNTYPCWYNPTNPQRAVLVLRHNWASTLPLAVPSVLGFIAAILLLKNTMQFFGLIGSNLKERKKRFKK